MVVKKKVLSQDEVNRMNLFENASDSYKKIFTSKGINIEGICDLIDNCLELAEPDERIWWAHRIMAISILCGPKNYYEAMGVIEAVKSEYQANFDEAMRSEHDNN